MRKQNWSIFLAIFLMLSLLGCNSAKRTESPETDFAWRIENDNVSITGYKGKSPDVAVPKRIQGRKVTKIGKRAFYESGIRSITLPDTLTHIDAEAFKENNLQAIVLPKNLEVIGYMAFSFNMLSSITIPPKVVEIGVFAFANNPLKEVIIKPKNFRQLPNYVFHPALPGYLIPGKYTHGGGLRAEKPPLPGYFIPGVNVNVTDDENWFYHSSDGKLLSMAEYLEKLKRDIPGVLPTLLYDAIDRMDTAMLKNCISLGADVNGKMLDGLGNTPLDKIFSNKWWNASFSAFFAETLEFLADMVAILLEAGAHPQYSMLNNCYYRPDTVKILLEYLSKTGSLDEDKLGAVLLNYCNGLAERYYTGSQYDPLIMESVAVLVEHGANVNYQDSRTGQTPLSVSMNDDIYFMDMTEFLLKHISRPLTIKEYRLLIGLNSNQRKAYHRYYDTEDKNPDDPYGIDTLILEDIRNGLLNPDDKDPGGKDIFDYAAASGSSGLMKGLLPYLLKSKRDILSADGTGLYIDAVNAKNHAAAAVLSTIMNNKFTKRDSRGNTYSLEYYNYDYDTIYRSAQHIPFHSLYQSGPGGTRRIGGEQRGVTYSPHKFYVMEEDYGDYLSLYFVDGKVIDLGAIINEQWIKYYRESKKEESDESAFPRWRVDNIFGDILFVRNSWYWYNDENTYILVNISGNKPIAYILGPQDNLIIEAMESWYEEGTRDFIIDAGKAYLIRRSGEVLVFAVGKNTLRLEKSVPWRECRIPGWKGGERLFVEDEIVTAYNFATGTKRTLGKNLRKEDNYYYSNYIYEDANGKRFIMGAGGKAYPMPDEEVKRIVTFDRGYIYDVKDENFKIICFLENNILKRKIVLSGSVLYYYSPPFSVHGNKIYTGMSCLAFTIDLTSMRVSRAFKTDRAGGNDGIDVFIFPLGTDDVVYTEYLDGGK